MPRSLGRALIGWSSQKRWNHKACFHSMHVHAWIDRPAATTYRWDLKRSIGTHKTSVTKTQDQVSKVEMFV